MSTFTYQLRPTQRLLPSFHSGFPIYTHPAQSMEAVVSKDENPAMIRFEVIDLFPEDELPEVFADEFDAVEWCLRTGFVC